MRSSVIALTHGVDRIAARLTPFSSHKCGVVSRCFVNKGGRIAFRSVSFERIPPVTV
jgi:hypothetical protein